MKEKKINSLPCLKVYIILFPKNNSNVCAHQVILKSLKANCHYSFGRDTVNIQLVFFYELSKYGRFLKEFISRDPDRRLGPSSSICCRNGTLVFCIRSFELCLFAPSVYLWVLAISRDTPFSSRASCNWGFYSSVTKPLLLQSDINGPDNWIDHNQR